MLTILMLMLTMLTMLMLVLAMLVLLMLMMLTMLTVLLLAVLASRKGRICFEQQVWEQLCRGRPAAAPEVVLAFFGTTVSRSHKTQEPVGAPIEVLGFRVGGERGGGGVGWFSY
jgi:hypothetical protein